MDPRFLLDPRGARTQGNHAPQHQDNRVIPQVQQPYDPRALLNPKSAAKRSAAEGGVDAGQEGAPVAGQMAFIERMHNVHERTASPSKRMRTEGESNQQKKPQSSMQGGGGALDLHSQNGQVQRPQTSVAIDLTLSDDEDDEISFVKDNSMQVICIGKIKQAYIQCHMVPSPDPTKYRGNHGQQGRMELRFRRAGSQKTTNVILVVDPAGNEFGRVDLKTAQGLAPLMDGTKESGLKWSAMTDARRKQPNEGGPGSPLSALISMSFQLYCPRKIAQEVGKFLKTRNIALVEPVFWINKFEYWNPQTKSGFPPIEATLAEQAAGQSQQNAGYNSSYAADSGNYVLRSVEEIRHDVQNMFDKLPDNAGLPEREQNTSLIKTKLMKHQKQALHFMWDREQDRSENSTLNDSLYQEKWRANGVKVYRNVITGQESTNRPSFLGGLLADEMGLGKTLSILALIFDTESLAIAQKFAQEAPPKHLSRHVTTNSRATLLVCPLSTLHNWSSQLKQHLGERIPFKVCTYHGQERRKFSVAQLANHDLVLTTYQMISTDVVDAARPLGRINWFRIVLDEAHTIRNIGTNQSKHAMLLEAQRRWAVTGTPVQNRLDDLGALLKFLRIKPFDETAGFNQYILAPFKNADADVVPKLQLLVNTVTLRRMKEGLVELPKRIDLIVRLPFSHDEEQLHRWFERDIAMKVNAVTTGPKQKLGGHVYARILTAILNLRLICAHGRELLSDEALKLTDGMTWENPMEIDEEDDTPSLTKKQAYDMLELLHETDADSCQYCNKKVLTDGIDSDDDEEEQDIIGYMTPCYHIICPRHIKSLRTQWAQLTTPDGFVTCNFCDQYVRNSIFELKHEERDADLQERERVKKDPKLSKKLGRYIGPHTKTKALLVELGKNRAESQANPDEPPVKSVIFSYWTSHLDLIQVALDDNSHQYTRLDGRMRRDQRHKALETFANDPSVPIILISMGAGGQGLNLTSANKVYVMEPQFNPAAEAQAVDRVHRIGQKREVTIMRFIMEKSFEEKMLSLQEKKKDLADLTMAREKMSKEEVARKRLEDLRSLFK
ncbi:SNF2 family N-terminal domain-domain-containing protein [Clohesyomyces aquaticus]|uniref:SNF2 family N-terminal domain-domain-containing protein n=1 Tax=Clohesyomyces aquaticus TaxID=1231657 RepID=A0A1Y2A8H2_9PLEO|nr:SNF2 family N-terminal domain-domain-containing protein [Clohesyomyces aquaticus]